MPRPYFNRRGQPRIAPTWDDVQSGDIDPDWCGWCLVCGEPIDSLEPDARGDECPECGHRTVYGFAELVLMGLVHDHDPAPGYQPRPPYRPRLVRGAADAPAWMCTHMTGRHWVYVRHFAEWMHPDLGDAMWLMECMDAPHFIPGGSMRPGTQTWIAR